jgi:ATP-dependent helicase HrpB
MARMRTEAKRLDRLFPPDQGLSVGAMAALAYPDRIAQRRKGGEARFLLSGGAGAAIDAADPLAASDLIVVLETDGNPTEARIRLAAPVSEADLRAVMTDRITGQDICHWGLREGRVIARRQDRLGALVLADQPLARPPMQLVAHSMADGVRALGLNLTGATARLATRVELLRAGGADLPDMSDAGLLADLDLWLTPRLTGLRSADDWRRFDAFPALAARLDPRQAHQVDRDAPDRFRTPLGREVPVDYTGGVPAIAVRLQEMFGQTTHPRVGRAPVRITLLSPGGHPIAVTTDLPGFWTGSYADVRRDMRGRYPRHPWPDDPRAADPTLRAKPRGT